MVITCTDFQFSFVKNRECVTLAKGNRGTRAKKREYKNLICAFDTETTYIESIDQNILYVWQVQIDEYFTVIGRTVDELMTFFKSLNDCMSGNEYIILFVHNLSYDWQFIRCLYDLPPDKVFAVKSRKILKCDILDHIELRCSYLHSNMSLDAYTRKMGVEHLKQSGAAYDYSKIRYPDTPLNKRELKYITHDVIGLVEAIKEEMRRENDTIYTFPLTSTGYVRRDVKRVLREWNRQRLNGLFPSGEVYTLLREEFRGGNTHANRFYTKNPDFPLSPLENVKSADRSSSYPDVIVNYKFPMTPFRKVSKEVTEKEFNDHYIKKRGYAVLARVVFEQIELKDIYYPCPYISLSKCRLEKYRTETGKIRNRKSYMLDNGRILNAEKIGLTINDIDWNIIKSQYKWSKCTIEKLYFARYDYLPEPLRDLVKDYYRKKTALKGLDGENKIYYDKFKNLINSIYGCMAQDPAKLNMIYDQDKSGDDLFHSDGTSAEERLDESHPSQPYQWGCWVTAWARYQLEIAINAVHECPTSNFVYADTDSVKYIGVYDWGNINERLRNLSETNGAYAEDKNGERHYMGVFEIDGVYRQFETMGAKSYIYTDHSGFHITIAGVPKRKGASEMARAARIRRKLGENVTVFDLYQDGFIFSDGVTLTTYNDANSPQEMDIDGHKVMLTSNITIKANTHEIGLSADYKWLLNNLPPGFVDII